MSFFKLSLILSLILLLSVSTFSQIEVTVEGISDASLLSEKEARDAAIMDAKLQAIERAGVHIEAVTIMENFQIKNDWVESRASGVILPGFQLVDVGVGDDGLYHVVLSCKISNPDLEGDTEGDKKYRMAKMMMDENGDIQQAIEILQDVVNNHSKCNSADDALYVLIVTEASREQANKNLIHMRAYFPASPLIAEAEDYVKNIEKHGIARFVKSMRFTKIPGGTFTMGSPQTENGHDADESPEHSVTVNAFQIMATEVTQAHWKKVMDKNPSKYKADNNPVDNVSWLDAQEFIRKLNLMDPGKGYRLPTEAEWEYACRASSNKRFSGGDSQLDLERIAWFKRNSNNKPHPVASKDPNPWGLYDMHGNVWEFCEDWHTWEYYSKSPESNPQGPDSGSGRIKRGGSWGNDDKACRSANRDKYKKANRHPHNGFRVVRNY